MKYITILIILLPLISSSQQHKKENWHVTVANAATGKSIAGATLKINGNLYLISNSNGSVDVDKKYLNTNDSLKLSCLGFQLQTYEIDKQFTYPDSVKLSPVDVMLKEVAINSSKSVMKLGDVRKSYNSHLRANPNVMFAQYIPNDKRITATITSIEYSINDITHGIEGPFKVGLYTKDKNSLYPDQKLLIDSVIIFNPERRKKIVVDVSKYNIPFPKDGVMAVMETLAPEHYSKEIVIVEGHEALKVPGIEIDLKRKGDFSADFEKRNRNTPYALVMGTDDSFTIEQLHYQAFVYLDGSNFGIAITVE